MEYLRKTTTLLLVLCLMLGVLVTPAAAEEEKKASEYRWITDREEVDGSDYTDSPAQAAALNAIFDGNASIYHDAACTKPVDVKLGSSRVPNNGVNKYVGPCDYSEMNIGTSCWIYANGVYFTLFDEATGNGTAGENSEKLDLSGTPNKNFSYDNFTAWGVRPGVGALIRTACGHSLIVLGYDEERVTILDGNGNGKGLISIRVITWDRMSFRAKYIIQPKQTYIDERYPVETAGISVSGKPVRAGREIME